MNPSLLVSCYLYILLAGFLAKHFDIFPLIFYSETRWISKLLDQKKESHVIDPQWAMKCQVVLTGVYGHTSAEAAVWFKSQAEFAILSINFAKPHRHMFHME